MGKFGKHQDIDIVSTVSEFKASQGQGSTFSFLTYLHKMILLRSVESGPKCKLKVVVHTCMHVFVTCSIVKHSWNHRRQAGAGRGRDVLLLERLRRLLTEL